MLLKCLSMEAAFKEVGCVCACVCVCIYIHIHILLYLIVKSIITISISYQYYSTNDLGTMANPLEKH